MSHGCRRGNAPRTWPPGGQSMWDMPLLCGRRPPGAVQLAARRQQVLRAFQGFRAGHDPGAAHLAAGRAEHVGHAAAVRAQAPGAAQLARRQQVLGAGLAEGA